MATVYDILLDVGTVVGNSRAIFLFRLRRYTEKSTRFIRLAQQHPTYVLQSVERSFFIHEKLQFRRRYLRSHYGHRNRPNLKRIRHSIGYFNQLVSETNTVRFWFGNSCVMRYVTPECVFQYFVKGDTSAESLVLYRFPCKQALNLTKYCVSIRSRAHEHKHTYLH